MSARVIPRWTTTCEECGVTVSGIDSVEIAQVYAALHDEANHPAEVENRRLTADHEPGA